MKRNGFACTCALVLVLATFVEGQVPQGTLTSTDLVQMALQRNREFLAAQARVTQAEALLRQAGLRPVPSIEAETATGKPLGSSGETQYSVGYFRPIETGGKRDKRIAVAEKGIELAKAEVEEQKRQLTFQVKSRFVAAVAEELRLNVVNRLIPVNRENYRVTASRVDLGDAAPLEQQLLLTDVNRAEAQQMTFTSRAEAAFLELKAVVSAAPAEPLALVSDLAGDGRQWTVEQLTNYAIQNRPDLRVLATLEQQAEAEVQVARAEGRPDVTASVRYSQTTSTFPQLGATPTGGLTPIRDKDNVLAFGIAVPLITQRRAQSAVDAAIARQTEARLRREHLLQTIAQEVQAAYRRWTGATRALTILQSGVIEQSEKNLTVIREAYRLGQLRVMDVLNEQRRVIETELAYVDAQADGAQALAELERAVGGNLP